MIAPSEDTNIHHLETHQHNPSCIPMAISLESIAGTLTVIKWLMMAGLGLAIGVVAYLLIFMVLL